VKVEHYYLYFFKSEDEMRKWSSSKLRDSPEIDPIGDIISWDNPIDIEHEILISEPFIRKFYVPEWVKNERAKFVVRKVVHILYDKMDKPITYLHLIPAE